MKKGLIVGLMLMVSVAAYAIDAGPGGRLYLVSKDTTNGGEVHLVSVQINADWTVAGWDDHGKVADVTTLDSGYRNGLLSPEIWTSGGTGYGELVMGLYFNGTPTSTVMDIVKITPSAGSLSTSLMSDGKDGVGSGYDDSLGRNAVKSTRNGYIVYPDRAGDYTGATDSLIYERKDYSDELYTLTDSQSDGDWADDDADYADGDVEGSWISTGSCDRELALDKYWDGDGWGPGSGADAIWYKSTPAAAGVIFADSSVQPNFSATPRFAVTTIQGHAAAFMASAWYYQSSGVSYIWGFIDYNDDGDALDQGEQITVVDETMIGNTFVLDQLSGGDMEIVEGPNGKKFLMAGRINQWSEGDSILIFGLADNGVYDGNGYVKWIERDIAGSDAGWGLGKIQFEFDPVAAAPIPEPGTMLLLGTGALCAFGVIRRRRMK